MTTDGDHRPSARITEFRPGELWKDTDGVAINAHGGGIMFHGGKYWWYGEYKTEGEAGNLAKWESVVILRMIFTIGRMRA